MFPQATKTRLLVRRGQKSTAAAISSSCALSARTLEPRILLRISGSSYGRDQQSPTLRTKASTHSELRANISLDWGRCFTKGSWPTSDHAGLHNPCRRASRLPLPIVVPKIPIAALRCLGWCLSIGSIRFRMRDVVGHQFALFLYECLLNHQLTTTRQEFFFSNNPAPATLGLPVSLGLDGTMRSSRQVPVMVRKHERTRHAGMLPFNMKILRIAKHAPLRHQDFSTAWSHSFA